MPYGLTFSHKHLPEMKLYAGLVHAIRCSSRSVGNYAQGMLGAVPLFFELLAKKVTSQRNSRIAWLPPTEGSAIDRGGPLPRSNASAEVDPQVLNNTNRMRLHVFANDARGQVLLMAIYDNLGKGASGAAVQNLNLMIGADANARR